MELLGNNDGRNFCSNLNHNVAQDSLEELVARAQDLAQRWQDAIDDCTSFNLAAVADAVVAAEEREKDFDLFAAYAAAEADSSYVADLDGFVAAVEAASDIWDEEQKRAAAVDLLDPVDYEADLDFSFDAPIAA